MLHLLPKCYYFDIIFSRALWKFFLNYSDCFLFSPWEAVPQSNILLQLSDVSLISSLNLFALLHQVTVITCPVNIHMNISGTWVIMKCYRSSCLFTSLYDHVQECHILQIMNRTIADNPYT